MVRDEGVLRIAGDRSALHGMAAVDARRSFRALYAPSLQISGRVRMAERIYGCSRRV